MPKKTDSLERDYEKILREVVKLKVQMEHRQNIKDVVKTILRMACDPERTKIKKASDTEIDVHHGDDSSRKWLADLTDKVIDGKIEITAALKESRANMSGKSKEEHAKITTGKAKSQNSKS